MCEQCETHEIEALNKYYTRETTEMVIYETFIRDNIVPVDADDTEIGALVEAYIEEAREYLFEHECDGLYCQDKDEEQFYKWACEIIREHLDGLEETD